MKQAKHAIALLDLGAVSGQTRGNGRIGFEAADCLRHGNQICP